jgi:hypothetical protein
VTTPFISFKATTSYGEVYSCPCWSENIFADYQHINTQHHQKESETIFEASASDTKEVQTQEVQAQQYLCFFA